MNTYENLTVSEFKRCVAEWANTFDPKYRTLLWVIGEQANKEGEDRYLSLPDIQHRMRNAYFRQGDRGGWVPGYSTLKRYVSELRKAGVLETEQTRYFKRGQWKWGANIIRPNFDRVLVNQTAENHDFLAALVPDDAEALAEVSPRRAPVEPPGEPPSSHKISPYPKSQHGSENRSLEQVRARGGFSRINTSTKPKTPGDLERVYGVDVSHLVERYGFDYVRIALDQMHLDWEEDSGGLPWLEHLTRIGGETAVVEKTQQVMKMKRVV